MHGRSRRLVIHLIDSFHDGYRERAYVLNHKFHADRGGDLENDMSAE
jgi:hypothetical protein